VGFFGFLGTTPSAGTGEEQSLDSKVFWVSTYSPVLNF